MNGMLKKMPPMSLDQFWNTAEKIFPNLTWIFNNTWQLV
uniref:Uncharacterized protein n=1 Tax=Anguilla anguilla TaxID=7936 RepID=A0A0E9Q202_ANGAN